MEIKYKPCPPHIQNAEIHQDSKTIFSQGLKLEKQHTRKTCGTSSRVHKHSNYLR